ncbi:MAG: hypothetical protein QM803_03235 [Rhodocyclaceae bacterium]
MKLKDARTAIYTRLGEALSPYSFKLNKSQEAFVRAVPEGRQSIYVSIVDMAPTFGLSVVIGLRADPVERICHLFSGAPEQYQKLSETAIVQLGYFTGRVEADYIITSTQDIDSATAAISLALREKVLPIMDECKSVAALAARSNAPQSNFNSAQPPYSCLTSLTLASLSNSDAFEDLASKAITAVAPLPSSERKKVEQLISHLRAEKKLHDTPTT